MQCAQIPEVHNALREFINNLPEGGKIDFAKKLGVSKAAITRWSKPVGHPDHRFPRLENALKIYAYTKSIKKPISLEELV